MSQRLSVYIVRLKSLIPKRIVPEPCSGAGYVALFRCRVCSSILLRLYMHSIVHSEPYAICMHVAVKPVHSLELKVEANTACAWMVQLATVKIL